MSMYLLGVLVSLLLLWVIGKFYYLEHPDYEPQLGIWILVVGFMITSWVGVFVGTALTVAIMAEYIDANLAKRCGRNIYVFLCKPRLWVEKSEDEK